MILFYDTETTGKADFHAEPSAKHQPRLVQLAAILTDDTGKDVASLNVIVRPNGFEIPAEATAIHGIDTGMAEDLGVPLLHALALFSSLSKISDLHCCHNIDFDALIMRGECDRMSVEFNRRNTFCTMKQMTPVCKLAGPYGPKWPKLQEAFVHCFGKEFDGAHDAMADVRACRDIFFWMKSQGLNENSY